MTMTIGPVSTKEFIGLSETKTIGYYGGCRAVAMPGAAVFISILRTFFERKALAKEAANWLNGSLNL
jgi:hypothetical protein